MSRWRKLASLSRAECWLLAQALGLLPFTAVALRLFGFGRVQSAFARKPPGGHTSIRAGIDRLSEARQAGRLVRIAAVFGPYRASCLQQSLVLWWLLRRRGIQSELRIGARKEAHTFQAHAWVEYHGVVLNDAAEIDTRFLPFERAIISDEG